MTAHAEWKYDGEINSYSGEVNNFYSYFDYSRINTEGRNKSIWVLSDFKSPQSHFDKTYKSEVRKQLVDCQAIRLQSVAVNLFSEQMSKGIRVSSYNYPFEESRWTYPLPDSFTERTINIACGRK